MDDKELLEKADEFLDMAFLGDGKEQSLMYRMKARLEELTADKEPEPKNIIWVPRVGETYFYIDDRGTVFSDVWVGTDYDHALLKNHNVYKTREQAVKAAPYQQRYNMVLQAVLNLEPDQVVDWKDKDQAKYTVYFDHFAGIWRDSWNCYAEKGYPPLTDKKNLQPLLDYLNAKEKSDERN